MALRNLLIYFGLLYFAGGEKACPDTAKAHLTRCDMYYKCSMLPSENFVWIPTKCPRGLVYEHSWKMCVLPGDDWECTLGDKKKTVVLEGIAVENSTYVKADDLKYLKQQLNGYGTAADRVNETLEEDDDDYLEMDNDTIEDDDEDDLESSGDDDKEDKAAFIPIPMNKDPQGIVASHLQRLSQLIKAMSNEHNKTTDLGPNDLNQFLAAHKIKIGGEPMYGLSSLSQVSIPVDGKIHPSTMNEILDLQEKIQKLGALRDSLSTPATPADNIVSGSGYYKPDATTLHIKTSNSVKSPRFPDAGIAPSQIVVNRPEGSVLFSLSNAGPIVSPEKEPYISEETLKTVLELSHQMASTNNPPTYSNYVQDHRHGYVQPLMRPLYYNVPVQDMSVPIITTFESGLKEKYGSTQDNYNKLKGSYGSTHENYSIHKDGYNSQSHIQNDKDKTMQKISSINGYLDTDDHFVGELPATIIHNHIPITISNPNPLNSILSSITTTTTPQPDNAEYDSYGSKVPAYTNHKSESYGTKTPSYTDLNNYYPYPPFDDNEPTHSTYSQSTTGYQPNRYPEKQYIQISQSKPEDEIYFGAHNSQVRPVLNFEALSSPTNPTAYSPSPHLNDHNVNEFVNIDAKPYSTLQPTEYKPFKYHSEQSPSSLSSSSALSSSSYSPQQSSSQLNPSYIPNSGQSYYSQSNSKLPNPQINYNQAESSRPSNSAQQTNSYPNSNKLSSSSNFESYAQERPQQYQSNQVNTGAHKYPLAPQYETKPQYERPQSYNQPQAEQRPTQVNRQPTTTFQSQVSSVQVHKPNYSSQQSIPAYSSTPEPTQTVPPMSHYEPLNSYESNQQTSNVLTAPSNVYVPHKEELTLFSELSQSDNVYNTDIQLDDNSITYAGANNQQLDEYDSSSYEASENDEELALNADLNTDKDVTDLLSNLAQQATAGDKRPLFQYNPSSSDNHKQFVNLGGNFISLETYQNSIEPFLHDGALLNTNIEVLTCATGVRQANNTDCTKYFVCNSNTGKVLSYTCPPYTAFNSDTKICNAKTYSDCVPGVNKDRITITENKRIQQEAQQALLEANRVKADAIKQQKLANMIKMQTQKILNQASQQMKKPQLRPAKASATPSTHKHHSTKTKYHSQSGGSGSSSSSSSSSSSGSTKRKRRIACRDEGKLADKLNVNNYFICFKDKTGKMKARKMTCPSSLMFCSSTKMCTSQKRCFHKR